ncbi:MAG TPA: LuxR C-terminal-related transcriptional regulator [Sporichthya sp.]|nr:LuxR C-terminal-related transcriptional regulator [Sporichthya sp.]
MTEPVTTLSDFREHRARWAAASGAPTAAPALTLPPSLAAPPPTGTVTFLLTDVEGSTPHWEAAPDAMAVAVARHYALLDAAVAAHHGVRPIEQGEGDSMVAVFAHASDAIAAALRAQRALVAEPWPAGCELSVRMALHTGEARLRDDLYYIGPSIIRCARLRSLAHGRQVVVSATTAALVADELPDGAELLPLGLHRLKGMGRPERVLQLVHPHLPAGFPALAAPDTRLGNLPGQPNLFVGRERVVAELVQLMGQRRHVTLVGAGGAGKTRLALRAAELAHGFEDGIWWVEFAPVSGESPLVNEVLTTLGLDARGLDPLARLTTYLADRDVLLVLDNCEHVLAEAAALAAALVARCPRLGLLATSREPLGTAGEVAFRVEPLEVIDPDSEVPRISGTEAVRLFVERAREVRPGFQLDDTNANAVAAICSRLDGLPLAIELAAARTRALSPQRILDGISRRLDLLVGGSRSALPHHQTLAASMTWSHDLLGEPDRVLLRRLSVFAGSFSLEAVEAVAGGDPLTPWDAVVLLAALVDRSLVVFDGDQYRLLQTVRDFAADRLADADETGALRLAHRAFYADLVATAHAELRTGPQLGTMDRLAPARPDIVAAIDGALANGDTEAAQRLVADVALFWHMNGRYSESAGCLRRVLAQTPDDRSGLRSEVLCALAEVSLAGMDAASGYGQPDAVLATELAAANGLPGVVGRALCVQGVAAAFLAPAVAGGVLQQACDAAETAGDEFTAGWSHAWAAFAAIWGLSDAALAAPHLAVVAGLARRTGSPFWTAWHGMLVGLQAQREGNPAAAIELLTPAIELAWVLGDPLLETYATIPLAEAYIDAANAAGTEAVIARSRAWQDRSCLGRTEWVQIRLARLALTQGDPARAEAEVVRLGGVLRELGFGFIEAEMDLVAGRAALLRGDVAAARSAHTTAAAVAEAMGSPSLLSGAANLDGRVARAEGRLGAAEDSHHRALALAQRQGLLLPALEALECLGGLAVAAESWAEGARLIAAASAARDRAGVPVPPVDAGVVEADLAAVGAAVGAESLAEYLAEGAALGAAEAAAYAARARGERKRPSIGWDSLTPTEHSVVTLAAEGLTNNQIAEKLFISTGTVKVHLHHIFTKLGMTRRAELAARATERRLAAGDHDQS